MLHDIMLMYVLQNHIGFTHQYCYGKDLLSSGNKPLPGSMSTKIYNMASPRLNDLTCNDVVGHY